jgi:hypothetical protein
MGRCLARTLEALNSATQSADGLPLKLRTQISGLVEELDNATAGDLVSTRLEEGWIAGRLILE